MKTYLKYTACATMGLIASPTANSVVTATLAITPTLETISLWNMKTGELVGTLAESGNKACVSCLEVDGDSVAAGYSDGSIRIWSLKTQQVVVTFNGHNGAVGVVVFGDGVLYSGGKDTDVIVWDLVDEVGVCRLRGHKDAVTGMVVLADGGLKHLVTCGKDGLLKVWCLKGGCCVETVVASGNDVWGLARVGDWLVTVAADQEVRVWDLDVEVVKSKLDGVSAGRNKEGVVEAGVTLRGIIERSSKERAVTIKVHASGRCFGVQAADKTVELFKVLSQDEIIKKSARRRRRLREKATKTGETIEEDKDDKLSVADEINVLVNVRCSAKIRSFDFVPSKREGQFVVMCALTSNAVEMHSVNADAEQEPTKLITTIALQGHRSDVRALAMSSDDEVLLSASASEIKLWNIHSQQSGYVLTAVFAPGNKYVVVGTKSGELEIYDLGAGVLVEAIKAHEGPVWSIDLTANGAGLVSGSADKDVKFWDFGVVQEEGLSIFALVHTKTLKMSDDVLCVRHSPDGKLLAISLLDCSIKVFYADTLKFFLNLYGHKLPVLTMDISSDSLLLVSGSADKSVRIWGLDFGDCRKSLRGHGESVMGLRFVWGTHYFFSVAKDRVVKYWDADKFENIMTLQGHQGEVWALAVAKFGRFIITGSADKSIRIWNKTDEQLFLEEERENELEQQYDQQELDQASRKDRPIGSGVQDDNGDYPLINDSELAAVDKKSLTGMKSGERILDAIEVWEGEQETAAQYQDVLKLNPEALPPAKSPFIIAINPAYTPEQYLLHVINRVRSTELDEALLSLPFSKLPHLFLNILAWLEHGWNTPLALRVLYNLLTVHHKQIVSTGSLKSVLGDIGEKIKGTVEEGCEVVGFNFAALGYLRREIRERGVVGFGDEVVVVEKKGKAGEKRKRVVIK